MRKLQLKNKKEITMAWHITKDNIDNGKWESL